MSEDEIKEGFRHAMRRLATTIALITSGKGENWTGMAATAVMSVCAEPPTLLTAVNRTASIHPVLMGRSASA
ncbi:flavin reductase [Rhizorhabdus histidinilytica]